MTNGFSVWVRAFVTGNGIRKSLSQNYKFSSTKMFYSSSNNSTKFMSSLSKTCCWWWWLRGKQKLVFVRFQYLILMLPKINDTNPTQKAVSKLQLKLFSLTASRLVYLMKAMKACEVFVSESQAGSEIKGEKVKLFLIHLRCEVLKSLVACFAFPLALRILSYICL